MESSRERIDEYISRITGVSIQVITTTRNWHRVLKRVIIEEGREALDTALEELEQELMIAEEWEKERQSARTGRKLIQPKCKMRRKIYRKKT